LLANLYLNPLDHEVARRVWEMVRYADDFVVLCRTREEADSVLSFLQHQAAAPVLSPQPTPTACGRARSTSQVQLLAPRLKLQVIYDLESKPFR
jgi:RNA-directed DNA polymerase